MTSLLCMSTHGMLPRVRIHSLPIGPRFGTTCINFCIIFFARIWWYWWVILILHSSSIRHISIAMIFVHPHVFTLTEISCNSWRGHRTWLHYIINTNMHPHLHMDCIIHILIIFLSDSIRFNSDVCNPPWIGYSWGILAPRPHHHPFVLPRWYTPRKPVLALNNIDRFVIRTTRLENTSQWQIFEVQIRQCIDRHSQLQRPQEVSMHALERDIRTICSQCFPKRKPRAQMIPQIPSMAARMWQAGKQALAIKGCSIRDLFECWAHLTTFRSLHSTNRKQSRQNKRNKLQKILTEGANLAFHGRTFDWYRKISLLCPKQ